MTRSAWIAFWVFCFVLGMTVAMVVLDTAWAS